MRVLLLLRGSAGCGKTTWIKENGLKPYTLSADDIRLLCQSPILQADASIAISPTNDKFVWKTLFNLLEARMQRGEFTVIDATNSKTLEMNRYKTLCDTYRYRIYCVDFTDIPIEEVKRRNANRESYKRVPDEVIDKMYSRFATQRIPSGIKVIKPNELDTIWMKTIDLSSYKKIHHIGDIHGCNTALQEYFNMQGGMKDDEFYIFLGDYIDRGLENAEVVKFLISIANKKNVLLLEGNHERWLWAYAHDKVSRSKDFELITKPELINSEIDKKDIRKLYRRLGQCAYYTYNGNTYLATHGGLSTILPNLTLVATEQMIKGVGNYSDFEVIAETFIKTMPENVFQIHGHRNTKNVPIQVNEKVFNLEGAVEFGGELRCVCIDAEGIHPIAIKNTVYKTQEILNKETITSSPIADTIIALRENKYIVEKKFENISSFNFSHKAFYDKAWDSQTIKARGLFIDTMKGKVVARSYEKFFNINERPETKFDMLQHRLAFPISAYVKENGFLGIVSYNEYENDLLITSKSALDGTFSQYLKDMIYEKVTQDNILKMKDYIKENNVSFVFECVDMGNDPHIIEYSENELILLDIVHNDMIFSKYDYETLVYIANQFGLKVKEKAFEIATWQEFYDWYYEVMQADYEYKGKKIEGFVIEDATGFMTKLKLTYYHFWKFMRNIVYETFKFGNIRNTAALTTPLANEFYAWIRELKNTKDIESIPKDICTLRNLFYKSKTSDNLDK